MLATFSTQFATNVIAPLAKAVAVNLPGARSTANHRECAPLQGKSISDGFTWRRTGRVHSWGERRGIPKSTPLLDTPLHPLHPRALYEWTRAVS